MQENTIPWVIKIFPAVVGAILALVLSGDIDASGKIQVSHVLGYMQDNLHKANLNQLYSVV